MKLRDYQENAINSIFQALDKGVQRQLIVIPTGGGKRLWDQTPVLTMDGWTQLADLSVGDLIFGRDGNLTKILGIHGVGTGPAYRVSFNDGTSVIADGDHLWTVRGRKSQNWHTYSTQQILDKGVTEPPRGNRKNGGYKWILPLVSPIDHPKRKLQVEPYLMGVLLANGSLTGTSVEFTSNDDYIHDYVANENPVWELVDSTRKEGARKTRINGLMRRLERLGLAQLTSRDKFIPEEYKLASVWQRMDLLAGLMDCDGSVELNRRASYHSCSPHLAEGVAELVRSLGGVAKVVKKHRSDGDIEYETSIWLENSPFYLPRKSECYNPSRPWFRAIESIEPVGEYPMRCLEVDADDHLYVVQDYIVTHNTVIFSHIPKKLDGKMLVLAHREELLDQAARTISTVNPDLKVSVEQADRYADIDDDVVIASVQTLGRDGTDRIKRFDPANFRSIVIDEAHHAPAKTYGNILGYFEPELQLGVTATPQRGDNVRLLDTFDDITFFITIQDLISKGYLVDMVGYRVNTETDISGVKTTSGDYAVGELSDTINTPERNNLIVDSYKQIAKDRKTIVFCATVDHAYALSKTFNDSGITSNCVVGSTDKTERAQIFEDFSNGKIQVLTNVGVATEGYDEPSIGCVILARPTKSPVIYSQAVGRGLRLFEGKNDCIVIDMCDVTKGKKPVGLPTLMGLPADFDAEGKPLTEVAEAFEELEEAAPAEAARSRSMKDIEAAWERIDLFMPPPINEAMAEYSSFIWMETSNDTYILNLANSERIRIEGDTLGRYTVIFRKKDGSEAVLGKTHSMEEAFTRTDNWVKRHRKDQLNLIDAEAAWRSDAPTPKQVKWLKKFGVPILSDMTKGQASLILDKMFKENPKPDKPAWLKAKIAKDKASKGIF